jgi:L-lactate utilization protein LutC
MKDSREKIFAAIRHGLRGSEKITAARNNQSPLKKTLDGGFQSLFDEFQLELKKLGGEAVVFAKEEDASKFIMDHIGENVFVYDDVLSFHKRLIDNLRVSAKMSSDFGRGYDKREVAIFDSAISSCLACVAETGTVTIANDMRLPAALVTKLFIIAEPHLLIPSLDELFTDKNRNFKGSNLFLITGPSRTADIEKELVTGVHGPREVIVIFIDEKDR